MIRIVHVISGLAMGGAEMMLYKLLSVTDRTRFSPSVLSLSHERAMFDRIAGLGVPVKILGMKKSFHVAEDFGRLAEALAAERPALIQTWMYHADSAVGILSFLVKLPPIIWGVRASSPRSHTQSMSTFLTTWLGARLSRFVPAKIIFNSERSLREHIQFGYDRRKSLVIPNGFDLRTFRPRRNHRDSVRGQLGIPSDAPLIGMIARFHAQKDHRTFVRAAGMLVRACPKAQFLLCGLGVTRENPALMEYLREEGVERNFHLLGSRQDVPELTSALDVAALSSVSREAFPNVIGEAMASGVPCVATDVGDSAAIIGDTGFIVPIGDARSLADRWLQLIALGPAGRRSLGARAHRRIKEGFSLESIAARYESTYAEVLSARAGRQDSQSRAP